VSRDIFNWIRLLRALLNLALKVSNDGASTTSLGNLCQGFTTLIVKNLFLTSSLNLPSLSLKPCIYISKYLENVSISQNKTKKHKNIQILAKFVYLLQKYSSFFLFFPLHSENLIFTLNLRILRVFAHTNSDSVSLPALNTCKDGNSGVKAAARGLRTVV